MRYFFFSVEYRTREMSGHGNIGIQSEVFPTKTKIKKDAIKILGAPYISEEEIIVNNFIEFKSKEDYDAYFEVKY